jgi:hypothetical protein
MIVGISIKTYIEELIFYQKYFSSKLDQEEALHVRDDQAC